MADMPAEMSDARPVARSGTPGRGFDVSFLVGFGSLPIVRQVGLMIGLAASVALGFAVVLWSQNEEYRPLTGVVSPRQTNEVAEVLSTSGIPHRIDPGSGMLLVPAERIHEARMKMAGANVVDGTQMGFELLDREQGFGVSQFMELARFRRSLEGELARSIASLNSVHNARVHLAIPKRTAFVRDQRKATASVTLALAPGATLDGDQVKAVMNLVAGAVPELSPEDVAVVDQRGSLLSRKEEDPALDRTERQLAYIQRLESKLQDKVANILVTVAGPERFRAEVNADVDFTTVEQTEESYDPEERVVRSEQNLEESRRGGDLAAGIPGALSNQPPGAGVAPETAAQAGTINEPGPGRPEQSRTQSTRNYEVDRTISHTRHQVGQVARLTVSVVLDDVRPGGARGEGADGETEGAWSEADLERIGALVRNAVGFRAERGDTVTVVSSPFVVRDVETVEAPGFWMEPWFLELAKQILGAIVVLLIVFLLLRPLFRNLSDAGETIKTHKAIALQAQNPSGSGTAQLASDRKLDSVRSMVAEQPETVARVVKQWTLTNE